MNKIDIIWAKCCGILGTEGTKLDAHANLFDMGLDSLGLAELVIQCEEVFGEGVITVDDIIANPIISEIAARLGGGTILCPAGRRPRHARRHVRVRVGGGTAASCRLPLLRRGCSLGQPRPDCSQDVACVGDGGPDASRSARPVCGGVSLGSPGRARAPILAGRNHGPQHPASRPVEALGTCVARTPPSSSHAVVQ